MPTIEDTTQLRIFLEAIDRVCEAVQGSGRAEFAAIIDAKIGARKQAGSAPRAPWPAESGLDEATLQLRGPGALSSRLSEFHLLDRLEICREIVLEMRRLTDMDGRPIVADIFCQVVNRAVEPAPKSAEVAVTSGAEALLAEGYCRLDGLLRPEQLTAVVSHFRECDCYNAHVSFLGDNIPRRIGAGAEAFHYGAHTLSDIVRAPFLVEAANHPALLAIVESYLGCTPVLYSLNAWWSFPGKIEPASVSQNFHRDRDDFRFCTLFVYLTDVDEESGPHVYVRRTHTRAHIERRLAELGPAGIASLSPEDRQLVDSGVLFGSEGYGIDRLVERLFADRTDVVVGPAGTAMLADTYGYHMGIPPRSQSRLMFWARYGTQPIYPTSHRLPWSRAVGRLPADPRTRYINGGIFGDVD